MADYTKKIKKILSNNGCYFVGMEKATMTYGTVQSKNVMLSLTEALLKKQVQMAY